MITATKLNPPNMYGSTCAIAPCEAKIRFSMFPKMSKPEKGKYGFKSILFTSFASPNISYSITNSNNS